MTKPSVKLGLLGLGNVGRKVILKNTNKYHFDFYWVADSRNLISKANGRPFTNSELLKVAQIKEHSPKQFGEECKAKISGSTVYNHEDVEQEATLISEMVKEPREDWIVIDASWIDAHSGGALARSALGCAGYCTANKNPWANFDQCSELYREAERSHTLLGLNCVTGVWVDQMEILPVVTRYLKNGRLRILKRDNSSMNLFFEKVGSGITADEAVASIRASGHLEPDAVGLEAEVRDQELKARITTNIIALLKNFKIKPSDKAISHEYPSEPLSLNPGDIAEWHRSGRTRKLYPALISEINVDAKSREISCAFRFDELSPDHALAKDLGANSAISIQAFDTTEFEWIQKPNRKKTGMFSHTGFGGGMKTAEKLLWEANRAFELSRSYSISTFSPIPMLWALENREAAAVRLVEQLANNL